MRISQSFSNLLLIGKIFSVFSCNKLTCLSYSLNENDDLSCIEVGCKSIGFLGLNLLSISNGLMPIFLDSKNEFEYMSLMCLFSSLLTDLNA